MRVELSPGACFLWAAMLLVLPLRWVLGALLAAGIHELWHYGAIRLCGGEVYELRLSAGGAQMVTLPLTRGKEILCAAAGPAGSFSLLLAARYLPAAAVCGLIQGLFNLLPLFPMDGGRILRSSLELLFPERGGRVFRWIEAGCILLLLFLGLRGVVRGGILLALPVLWMIARKIPCKESKVGVQ